MSRFRDRLAERILLFDGAMGTMLQASGMPVGKCPELLNVERPESVAAVHKAYAQAGADAVTTNTFGANRVKLAAYGLERRAAELNAAAVRLARRAVGDSVLVAGDIGPTGRFCAPVGDLSFEEAEEVFGLQAEALAGAGADLLIFETFTDIRELRAALVAARTRTGLPAVALMTFEPVGSTLLGGTPEAAAVTLEALGVQAVGSNCGTGPEGMIEVVRRMAAVTALPLAALPNAGMPRLEGGRTVFPASPEDLAGHLEDFVYAGAGILGGCCGTTPAHIALMRKHIDRLSPTARVLTDPRSTRLSSRSRVLFLGGESPLAVIGERLNPTGRKAMAEAVREGRFDVYREEARRQAEAGAQMLDVNVGVPGIDEPGAMAAAVLAVSQGAPLPLGIDSPRPDALEAGLRAADGKPLLNSTTGEPQSLERVLPLARRYGAAVLGLTLDQSGIPARAVDRLAIARRILEASRAAGIPDSDVVIDCLTLSAGAEQEAVFETVRAVRMVREELGLNTVLGVSNVSFGLPARDHLNAAFLSMAAAAGLSGAIVNPLSESAMRAAASCRVLLNQDRSGRAYIAGARAVGEPPPPVRSAASPREELFRLVVEGDPEGAARISEELLSEGAAPMELGQTVLIPAMSEVGGRFSRNEYFLPQVILSARAMKAAFDPIRQRLKGRGIAPRGRVLMATVEGDVHDIGKNIVITLLENHGYEVTDLGKNVPARQIAQRAAECGCGAIGLSALMTTTMTRMKEAVAAVREAGLAVPVVVGGAAVTADYAREIGADGYAKDATEAVRVFEGLMARSGGS